MRRRVAVTAFGLVMGCLAATPARAVRVAMVKGFSGVAPGLPVVAELNDHWDRYGDTRVIIDRSLIDVSSFDHADLVATGADVLWISNPAGGLKQYTPAEIEAVAQYASEGHHVFGTFRVFRFDRFDNRTLAPVFGLPEISYNIGSITSDLSFSLIDDTHPMFANLTDPYESMGFNRAQVPNDDGSWNQNDFGNATLMAVTDDQHGVITLFKTDTYHAVYCSLLVEFVADPVHAADTQFIYNVLTLNAAPTGTCCMGSGRCEVVEEAACSGDWTQGGTCDPNPCPQLGACCGKICSIGFETECLFGMWTEGIDCVVDDDGDGVIDACDVCLGFDDLSDADGDSVPDGCDRCPGFDDALDADGDEAPDACDLCPGFDDRLDADGDGAPDGCDVCPGFDDTLDCDGNGIPDGCEDEPDCNKNGLPDNCDIDDGSQDCDTNGVPDECQGDEDNDGIIDPCDRCVGDDTLVGNPCDSPLDVDDCRTGVFACDTGTLTCSDDAAQDDVDSDGDGVFDCNDLCADTPPDVIVRPDGCRPVGACCFTQDVCFDGVPTEDCTLIGGTLLGTELTCNGDPDGDGAVGCDDGCPIDPDKSSPGQCGCGEPDTDSDKDGSADCVDLCPNDGNKIEPGLCGCGQSDEDRDHDGSIDCLDGCPDDPDKTDPGVCGCGVADVDSDQDGTLDCLDGCPNDSSKIEPGVCGCGVPDVDSDHDGTFDCGDECPNDGSKITPGVCGCGVIEDTTDEDGDGVVGCLDTCPGTEPDTVVDNNGCPLSGACCFRAGGGVCVDGTMLAACLVVNGRYQGNGSGCADGCVFPNDGDVDADGVIDLDDYPFFAGCMGGPDIVIGAGNCDTFDFDVSDTVDLSDFAVMQRTFGQP